ncbi:MAG TPA: ABC transporter permease [Verrucomicrobiae bacterium]|nr:ABC transporter permease [Verrucomicrobiae bacterium]
MRIFAKRVRSRIAAVFRKEKLDAEMEEELRAHLEMRTDLNRNAGMTPEQARLAALRQFGWVESIKEACREERGLTWVEHIAKDLRFGARMLGKHRGFTAIVILTLALGIGANTAIFSVVNAVLLRPLPYPDPDRLVMLWERSPERGLEQGLVSGPNYLDWKAQSKSFAEMAVCPGWQGSTEFNLILEDGVKKVPGTYASASLFKTFGVEPLLGRVFLPEEDQRQGNRAAVLSWHLWQRDFGGDRDVLGKTLRIDTYGRRDYTIVGVMPEGFGVPSQCELWLPLGWMGVSLTERRSAHWHHVFARLKDGATLEQAGVELNTIQKRLRQDHAGEAVGSEAAVEPLLDQAVGRKMKLAFFILWGVVAAVLLIACANVANLLLVRAAARDKEIAIRLALGASRARIIAQLLVESVMLGLGGGVAGLLLAHWAVKAFVAMAPADIPRLAEAHIDPAALGFTLLVSILTGTLFGLIPAWQFSRPDLNSSLKDSGHAHTGESAGLRPSRMRDALVIGEVALSLVLLTGAALMLQSFGQLLRAERGFRPGHLLVSELDFSVSGFTTWVQPTATRPQASLRRVLENLRAYPGVEFVGAVSALPRRDRNPPNQGFSIFDQPRVAPDARPTAEQKGITPDYLRAMGVPLLRGRWFTEADTLQARGVVLVNEAFARRIFPKEDPIGKFVTMGDGAAPLDATDQYGVAIWCQIVGVVGDLKTLTVEPLAVPEVYRPYWQWPMQNPVLVLRAMGEPAALASAIRAEVKTTIPQLPLPRVRTMDGLLGEVLAEPRWQTWLLSFFGAIAILLAAIGLYGVLAFSVRQRTHEIGIRMALGAQRRDAVWFVVAQGMRLTVIGVCIGTLGAFVLTRVMASLLYQIKPTDPLTLCAVVLLLMAVGFLASWVPARRAAMVQPAVALRCE